MYEVRFPMEVRAIDIMARIMKVPGAQVIRIFFTHPGRRGEVNRMKRVYQLIGPRVDFIGLLS
jgi:hypothetical protein